MSNEITNEPEIRFKGYAGDWEQRKVGEIFEKVSNKVKVEKKAFYKQIGIRSHGKGIFYKEEVTGEQLGNKSIFWVEPNVFIVNIVFAWEQAVTHTTENERGMVASHRFPMYRPIANILDLDYITMYFKTSRGKQLLESASPGGAGRNKTLGQKEFANLKISLPSVEEQQKIGTFFKQLDDTIALHQRELDLLEQTKQSYLQKMFPKTGEDKPEIRFAGFTDAWEQRKLGEIGKTYTGLTGKSKEDFGHGDAKFVTYMNVFQNPKATLEQLENVEIDPRQNEVKKGDVFFTTSSETPEDVGMSSVWTYEINNIYLNSFTFAYRPTIKFDLDYLAFMLRSQSVRKKIIFLAQGISRYNISKTKMMDISVPIPVNFEEQQKIGTFFKQLDDTIALHQRELDSLKEMKKSLLQKIFA